MATDRSVITGGTVLLSGEAGARPADLMLEGDSIAAIVPPGTRSMPSRSTPPIG